ncbi:hypothetical protein SAMN04488047_11756 [Tranquillimonas alkanivorans]|uniref:Uncharacterized protein n=1 Tax=Tranquillimonas alkanivorans TaxID=441119 RepID=A0A1I5U4T4_9RHOB|nr:hypothetical protein SAMN04488047_11756 [Tranquillimonas alkanivorans]
MTQDPKHEAVTATDDKGGRYTAILGDGTPRLED